MTGQGLAAADRVRRRPDFERAYTSGVRIHGQLMTLFVVPNGGVTSRLGVAATRKLGSAVQRNRAKRLAREVFRRHKLGSGVDVVIVPRREILDAPFSAIERDYLASLERRTSARPAGKPKARDRRRPRSASCV